MFKVMERRPATEGGVSIRDAVARSRSATVQRIASISKLKVNASVSTVPNVSEMCALVSL